ncbi:DUF697 domain-containing protein [Rhodohalobacter mucosus]|uniref:DUF697 domain-containing protein n=1 Tax=Rhodohalobacter mucosus TaxID=2079485 RepID=A0A316TZ05_9BACT|nr:DUF697 domain-containing protein [Rhodohalobacter mucosus]PWN08104.1 hypothetical protein DDZ15_00255 [Rhodohalobacter mucosus]
MKKQMKTVAAIAALAITILLIIVIINQAVQFSGVLATIHPLLGQISLILFVLVILTALLAPLYLYIRLPSRLIPPDSEEGPDYDRYMDKLSVRLSSNPKVSLEKVVSEEEIHLALKELDAESDLIIKKTAYRAFITTAISQNGALDALFILGLQFRLIWELARVYSQRPNLKELSFLYTNVMVTAFIASSLDEAEYFEILESSMSQGVGSVISMVPGTSLIVNSTITGSSNAFLTLRVGKVAQKYCNSLVRKERQTIRNSATTEAAKMLAGIIYDGTKKLVAHLGSAPIRMASRPFMRKDKGSE